MKTVIELGKAVKKKYPEYRDMDDAELGRRIKKQFPGDYDDYVDLGLQKIAKQVEEDVDTLEGHYSPDSGRIESWVRRKRSESRTKNAIQQTTEISTATNLRNSVNSAKSSVMASEYAFKQAPAKLRENRQHEKLIHKNTIERTKEATKKKVNPNSLDSLMQEEHKTKQVVKLEKKKAQIEVKKTKALGDHEVEVDFRKKMNTLVAITRYNHLRYDAFDEVRGRLVTLIKEAHAIEISDMNVSLKADIMGKMQLAIDAYQEVFDAIRGRLVEGGDGEEMGQIGSITEFTGGGGSGSPATPFKLHSAEPGDRD